MNQALQAASCQALGLIMFANDDVLAGGDPAQAPDTLLLSSTETIQNQRLVIRLLGSASSIFRASTF